MWKKKRRTITRRMIMKTSLTEEGGRIDEKEEQQEEEGRIDEKQEDEEDGGVTEAGGLT